MFVIVCLRVGVVSAIESGPASSVGHSYYSKSTFGLKKSSGLLAPLYVRGGSNVENNSIESNPIVSAEAQQSVEQSVSAEDGRNPIVTKALDESFPSPLRHRVQLISIPKFNVDIFLLGTAHISRDSARDATWLMKHIRPDCLFVELCYQRTALLLPPALDQNQPDPPNNSKKDTGDMSRTAVLSSTLLTKIQSDYASKLNVTIGGEFHAAYQCAYQQQKEYERMLQWHYLYGRTSLGMEPVVNTNGCVIVLGDRPVKLTLIRAWESLRWWGKCKLVLALLWSSLRQPSMEELKKWMDTIMNDPNSDLLTKSIEELKNHFPSMERVIIQERDHYMTYKLYQTARVLSAFSSQHLHHDSPQPLQKKTIVAIVGAGHCRGIVRQFESIISNSSHTNNDSITVDELQHQEALAALVETKRYKVENNNDVKSLTTDITQLQYPN